MLCRAAKARRQAAVKWGCWVNKLASRLQKQRCLTSRQVETMFASALVASGIDQAKRWTGGRSHGRAGGVTHNRAGLEVILPPPGEIVREKAEAARGSSTAQGDAQWGQSWADRGRQVSTDQHVGQDNHEGRADRQGRLHVCLCFSTTAHFVTVVEPTHGYTGFATTPHHLNNS